MFWQKSGILQSGGWENVGVVRVRVKGVKGWIVTVDAINGYRIEVNKGQVSVQSSTLPAPTIESKGASPSKQ